MSLDLNVYCEKISADLVPKIVKRLNSFDMVVEVHPEFKLDQESDTGFVPFKFKLKHPYFNKLKDKYLISGFEIIIDDFDLERSKEELQPKLSFIAKLLGKKQTGVYFASPELENRLKVCKKVVTFSWLSNNTFELRFALLTSAILTELTNGICYNPADDFWYDNTNIVEVAFKEIIDYEKSIKEEGFEFYEFDKW